MKKSLTTSAAALIAGLVLPSLAPVAAEGQETVPPTLTLQEALEIALRNNPRVQAARNDVGVAD